MARRSHRAGGRSAAKRRARETAIIDRRRRRDRIARQTREMARQAMLRANDRAWRRLIAVVHGPWLVQTDTGSWIKVAGDDDRSMTLRSQWRSYPIYRDGRPVGVRLRAPGMVSPGTDTDKGPRTPPIDTSDRRGMNRPDPAPIGSDVRSAIERRYRADRLEQMIDDARTDVQVPITVPIVKP